MTDQDLAMILPEERQPLAKILQLLAKRRIHPAKNEGWQTTSTLADSESSGDGSTPVSSATTGGNGQN